MYGGTPLKRKLSIGIILVVLSTSILIVNAEPYEPKTIYVDDVPGEGPNNPPEDYTSIQDAIDACNNGDIVYVYSGFYQLENTANQIISITKPINLVGENKNTTIIDGTNQIDCLDIDGETDEEILISGFTFQNAEYGIRIKGEMTARIKENVFTNFARNAITIQQSYCDIFINSNQFFTNKFGIVVAYEEQNPYVEISKNKISNNEYGILVFSNTVVIKENIISNNEEAITINDVTDCIITNNHIINNKIGFFYVKSWCSLVNNNFINNDYDYYISAGIYLIELPLLVNKHIWSGNYWNEWHYNIPKPITGTFVIAIKAKINGSIKTVPIIILPLLIIDKNPANEPYDINVRL